MKRFGKWALGIILAILIIYLVGPKPSRPDFTEYEINLPASLTDLENTINLSESVVKGMRPDNHAKIIC